MTPKLSNLNIVLGYWNENMNQGFRFNNPKQCSNWIILVSFCSSHLAIKNCYNIHFMKIEKIDAKIDFSAKNSKKVCVLQRRACNKFKRNYLENYNDSEDAVKTKMLHFSWSFRIYHFSYDCKLLDWSFKAGNFGIHYTTTWADDF